MKDNEKLCLYCEHCVLSLSTPDWSDWTPGNEFKLWCSKNHWDFDPYATSKLSMAESLRKAMTCTDYALSAEAKEIMES